MELLNALKLVEDNLDRIQDHLDDAWDDFVRGLHGALQYVMDDKFEEAANELENLFSKNAYIWSLAGDVNREVRTVHTVDVGITRTRGALSSYAQTRDRTQVKLIVQRLLARDSLKKVGQKTDEKR